MADISSREGQQIIAVADQRIPNSGEWPKIPLVTPSLNSVRNVEQTIQSVISQQYPNQEYFIMDGGSTDGTLDVIRKYEGQLSGWWSEPGKGMYDAINRGFARSPGEIVCAPAAAKSGN